MSEMNISWKTGIYYKRFHRGKDLTSERLAELETQLLTSIREYQQGELSLGGLLRSLRSELLQMNQTEFAQWVGVSRKTISDLEREAGSQSSSVLDRVFRPFGMGSGVVPVSRALRKRLQD